MDFNQLHRTFLKQFPLFIWLLFAVCSVSNFRPDTGGAEVISYLGSLVQFSPAAGRAGRCRQMSLCVGSPRRVLAKQPAVLAASPRVLRAFSLHGERLGRPEVCVRSPLARCAFSLRGERPWQPEAWRPLHGRAAPFPSAAPARADRRVSGSLQTGPGACLPGGRGWLLWG